MSRNCLYNLNILRNIIKYFNIIYMVYFLFLFLFFLIIKIKNSNRNKNHIPYKLNKKFRFNIIYILKRKNKL
jgi:hypothetical protein